MYKNINTYSPLNVKINESCVKRKIVKKCMWLIPEILDKFDYTQDNL